MSHRPAPSGHRTALLAALACSTLGACFGDGQTGTEDTAREPEESSGEVPRATGDAAAPTRVDPQDGGGDPQEVPTESRALFAYLQRGDYRAFTAESGVHQSTGPHGGRVRTYVNESLLQTLARDVDHAVGAAAVKELYGSGDTLTGWAVEVKVQADSADGDGWYWYEVFSTDSGDAPIQGVGHGTCTGCHASGRDYVRTPFPLQ